MLAHQLVRLSESHEMVRLRRVMFILDAPLVPLHKLYLSLCITIIVSTGTKWSTVWSTLKKSSGNGKSLQMYTHINTPVYIIRSSLVS